MEDQWQSLGSRVREARFIRQLDQTALAARLGVERSVLAKIESGSRRVSALELAALGRELSLPLTYFVTQTPSAMVSRREVLQSSATEVERTRFEVDLLLEEHLSEVNQIRSLGYLPTAQRVSGSVTTVQEATNLAARTRDVLTVGVQPLGPMADVAADLGLWLLVIEHGLEGASLTPEPGFGVGILGAGKDPGRRRFTAAHEIGHHLIGDEYVSDIGVAASRDERERVVNAFAQALLIPSSACALALTKATEGQLRDEMIRLSATYRVSWSTACRAVSDIAPERKEALRKLQIATPLRADFVRVVGATVPEDLKAGQTSSAWQQAVLRAHHDAKISINRTLEMLHGALIGDDLPDVEHPATW